ncbi:MAG: hypothetical protein ACP5GJ_02650 [Nanopusillaceae archaeon]
MLANIFIFQLSVIADIILFGFGIYMSYRNRITEIPDVLHAVMIGIYSSAFLSFMLFQVNPLFIIGTGFDWFISYVSGWLIGLSINKLISS